jgi:hypothetical protein
MPRDPSGNYSLPALGNPAVTNTPITIAWWNGTSTDMASAFTDSLSRSGLGGMLVPFTLVDGSAAAPAFSFQSETNTGFYRAASGEMDVSVGGTRLSRWTSAGFQESLDNGSTWKTPVYADVAAQSMGTTGALDFALSKLTIAGVAVRTTTAATISSSSGSYTTSSTAFATPTNLSISWTSTGGRVFISLQPAPGTLNNALISNSSGVSGTLKLSTGANTYQFDVTSLNGNMAPGSFSAVTPVLTAGSYTILCQVKTSIGQTFTVSNCELAVYEI